MPSGRIPPTYGTSCFFCETVDASPILQHGEPDSRKIGYGVCLHTRAHLRRLQQPQIVAIAANQTHLDTPHFIHHTCFHRITNTLSHRNSINQFDMDHQPIIFDDGARGTKRLRTLSEPNAQQYQNDDGQAHAQKHERRTDIIPLQCGVLFEYDGANGVHRERSLDNAGLRVLRDANSQYAFGARDLTPVDPRVDWSSLPMDIKAMIIGRIGFSWWCWRR